MIKYIKAALREFIGLENDYESLLSNQEQILNKLQQLEQLEKLEKLEIQNNELILEKKKESYYDYLTIKNALWVLFFLSLIGGGFWLYNSDLANISNILNNSNLELIKSLETLSKGLHETSDRLHVCVCLS
jgi:hypothetical protein